MGFKWTDCYLQESKALQVREIINFDKKTVNSALTTSTILAIDDADGDSDDGEYN